MEGSGWGDYYVFSKFLQFFENIFNFVLCGVREWLKAALPTNVSVSLGLCGFYYTAECSSAFWQGKYNLRHNLNIWTKLLNMINLFFPLFRVFYFLCQISESTLHHYICSFNIICLDFSCLFFLCHFYALQSWNRCGAYIAYVLCDLCGLLHHIFWVSTPYQYWFFWLLIPSFGLWGYSLPMSCHISRVYIYHISIDLYDLLHHILISVFLHHVFIPNFDFCLLFEWVDLF